MSYNLTTMQFIYVDGSEIGEIKHDNSAVYQTTITTDYTEPFYLEDASGSANEVAVIRSTYQSPNFEIETSTDKINWTSIGYVNTSPHIQIPANGKVYLRCNTDKWSVNAVYSNRTSIIQTENTLNFKVGGNIMSLLYGSNFTGKEKSFPNNSICNFPGLFSQNNKLIDASKLLLPANILTIGCYSAMFYGCSALTAVPKILPGVVLDENSYESMFRGTSITTPPILFANTTAPWCCLNMFFGCASLTTAPALLATTLTHHCYTDLFYNCTSLTTAPLLRAATLVSHCYDSMFYNCTALNNVTCLAINGINTDFSTLNWLYNVASTGTFTKANSITWPEGENGIPSNWTVVEN